MKTPFRTLMQFVISLALIACVFATSGCGTQNLAAQFTAFEKLGVTEAQVTGKFSSTNYKVTREYGTRTATFDHTNMWLPKVYFKRQTPLAPESSMPAPATDEPPKTPTTTLRAPLLLPPTTPAEFVGPLPPPGLVVPPATPLSPSTGR